MKLTRVALMGWVSTLVVASGLSAGGLPAALAVPTVSGGMLAMPKGLAERPSLPKPEGWLPEAPWLAGKGWPADAGMQAGMAGYLPGSGSVDARGQYHYSQPLWTPTGRLGVAPNVSVEYDGSLTNGPLGVGFSLRGVMSAITRCGKSFATDGFVGGVHYQNGLGETSDRFCLDGQKLVQVQGGEGQEEYRTEVESFARIRAYGSAPGVAPERFVVESRDGMISTYEAITGTRYEGHADTLLNKGAGLGEQRVLWVLKTVQDRSKNTVTYEYEVIREPQVMPFGELFTPVESLEVLPSKIFYTSNTQPGVSPSLQKAYRSLQLQYEMRPGPATTGVSLSDVEDAYSAGIYWRRTKRLASITAYAPLPNAPGDGAPTQAAVTYNFTYKTSPHSGRSLLTSVQQCPFDGKVVKGGGCLWKKEFSWYETSSAPMFTAQALPTVTFEQGNLGTRHLREVTALDMNGDGLDDVVIQSVGSGGSAQLWRGERWANGTVTPLSQAVSGVLPISASLSQPSVYLNQASSIDLDGDGTSELLAKTRVQQISGGQITYQCQQQLLRWNDGLRSFGFVTGRPSLDPYVCGTLGPYLAGKAEESIRFLDLDGDGRLDMLRAVEQPSSWDSHLVPGNWLAYRNTGDDFTLLNPNGIWSGCPVHILDSDGDGRDEALAIEVSSDELVNMPQGKVPAVDLPPSSQCVATDTSSPGKVRSVVQLQKAENANTVTMTASPTPSSLGPTADYKWESAGPNEPVVARERGVLWGDFNGDGLVDAALTQGNALPADSMRTMSWSFRGIRWNTGNGFTPLMPLSGLPSGFHEARFIDANEDGRMDMWLLPLPTLPNSVGVVFPQLYLSNGNGSFSYSPITDEAGREVIAAQWLDDDGTGTLDDNRDGKLDDDVLKDPGFSTSLFLDADGNGLLDWLVVRDGQPSTLYRRTLRKDVDTAAESFADRLKAVKDEGSVWPSEEVLYSTQLADKAEALPLAACAYPQRCPRGGMVVAREVRYRDHLVNPVNWKTEYRRRQISYERPVSDVKRGFLGYRARRDWDPLSGYEVVTEYDQQTAVPVGVGQVPVYPYTLAPKRVTTVRPYLTWAQQQSGTLPTGNVQARVMREEALLTEVKPFNQNKTWLRLPREARYSEWEQYVTIDANLTNTVANGSLNRVFGVQEPATPLRRVTQSFAYDDFANVTDADTQVQGGARTTVTASYTNNTTDWLLGLMNAQTITAAEADPTIPQRQTKTNYYYTPQGQVSYIDYAPDANASDKTAWSRVSFAYNTVGQMIRKTVSGVNGQGTVENRQTHYDYDYDPSLGWPNEQVYVTQLWSPLVLATQNGKPLQLSTWSAPHPAFGVPIATQDALGTKSQFKYDTSGRLIWRQSDGALPSTLSYSARTDKAGGYNGLVLTSTQGTSVNPAKSVMMEQVVDRLGRALITRGQGFQGELLETQQQYDGRGRLIAASRPYTPPALPAGYSRWEYDNLGRVMKETTPDNKITTYAHTFFTSKATDPLGYQRQSEVDVNGRLVKSIEYLKDPVSGTVKPLETRRAYQAFGLLDTVWDAENHATTYTYDVWNRLTEENTTDTGKTEIKTDSFGQTYWTQANSGDITTSVFDELGRLTSTRRQDKSGATLFQTQHVWDTASNGLGQLATATAYNGALPVAEQVNTEWSYDLLGRSTQVMQTVSNRKFVMGSAYDAFTGQLRALTYPASGSDPLVPGYKVCYHYTPLGDLERIGSVSNTNPSAACPTLDSQGAAPGYAALWHATERTLERAQSRLGNGLVSQSLYSPTTGRLNARSAFPAATPQAAVMDLRYGYYDNGLLQDRQDLANRDTKTGAPQPRLEAFRYDTLSRLTDWTLTVDSQVRQTRYGYTPIGNLTNVWFGQAPQGQTPSLQEIERNQYAYADKVHAISRHDVLSNGQVTQAIDYDYDAQGRQTKSRLTANGKTQDDRQIDYVLPHMPRTLATPEGTWTYLYDAFGQRVKKTGKGDTTYYFGSFERRERGNEAHHVLHLPGMDGHATQVLITPGASPTQDVSYVLTDALGSSGVTTDASGQVTERVFNEPFGRRLNADGTPYTETVGQNFLNKLTHGFTGHEMEFYGATNPLINMGGRLYDPLSRRVLTADPARSDLNRYSYVRNSPLNLIDPSGFECTTTATPTDPAHPENAGSTITHSGCGPDTSSPIPELTNGNDRLPGQGSPLGQLPSGGNVQSGTPERNRDVGNRPGNGGHNPGSTTPGNPGTGAQPQNPAGVREHIYVKAPLKALLVRRDRAINDRFWDWVFDDDFDPEVEDSDLDPLGRGDPYDPNSTAHEMCERIGDCPIGPPAPPASPKKRFMQAITIFTLPMGVKGGARGPVPETIGRASRAGGPGPRLQLELEPPESSLPSTNPVPPTESSLPSTNPVPPESSLPSTNPLPPTVAPGSVRIPPKPQPTPPPPTMRSPPTPLPPTLRSPRTDLDWNK